MICGRLPLMADTHLIRSNPKSPRIMGIVNVTPDSFSDGGRFLDAGQAIAHARRLIAEGADILDIGGESTRPHAQPVSVDEELSRVMPVIEALAGEAVVSIDTMKPAVARAAMAAGAVIWNDVTALGHTANSAQTAADLGCDVVLMHVLGGPATMQDDPRYDDVVGEVEAFLLDRAAKAQAAGVARTKIWLDPGIGFGKTPAHNLALIANLARLAVHGYPIVLGASRKRFITALDPEALTPEARLGGSIAVALAGARAGVAVVRVHDVAATRQALAIDAAIRQA
jgi:dihydropteroate synthase